jgi:hypothetical protein
VKRSSARAKPTIGRLRSRPLVNRTLASWADSIGTSVSATTSAATFENVMVRISSRKIRAARPLTSRNGTTEARLVRFEATTAEDTSFAPSCAARSGSAVPRWRWRKMFSSMTIELSIRSPTPSARPPRLMMFSVSPPMPIIMNVASTASGIASPMMKVLRRLPRNSSTASIASAPPITAESETPSTALRMKNDWSAITS